jgi:hypothetical protein
MLLASIGILLERLLLSKTKDNVEVVGHLQVSLFISLFYYLKALLVMTYHNNMFSSAQIPMRKQKWIKSWIWVAKMAESWIHLQAYQMTMEYLYKSLSHIWMPTMLEYNNQSLIFVMQLTPLCIMPIQALQIWITTNKSQTRN